MTEKLRLGIPKGSLQDATVALFRRSGWKITIGERSYFPKIDDESLECLICRAQEMSRYVESGILDAGLTGKDWIAENNSDVHMVADLIYSKASGQYARWVLAVKNGSPIEKLEDLEGKTIATELVGFTNRYFSERGINVKVEFSWGATEGKVITGLADAIVEVTETGTTIDAHGLKVVKELMRTNTQLIANNDAWKVPFKREKIEQISLLLQGALSGEKLVGLKMNVQEKDLERVIAVLPSLKAPTVAHLHQTDWLSVESVIGTDVVRDLIPELLKNGAEGIIEYPLNKAL